MSTKEPEGPKSGVTRPWGSAALALVPNDAASLSAGNTAPFASEAMGLKPGDWDWEALEAHFRPRLLGLAMASYRFTREEAEDALHSVYLKVLTRDPRVKDPAAYLRIAFINTCINVATEKWRLAKESLPDADDEAAIDRADERLIGKLHATRVVNAALRSAAPRCKRIVGLYYGYDYTLEEMSRATGYSRKTVWKRIWGCLRKMRDALETVAA